jgi:ribosomal protein S18 acetylase RimI-like enzyme
MYKILYESNPNSDDIHVLSLGITEYAKQQKGVAPIEPFGFFIRDEDGKVVGGCNGNIGYGWIYVDQLWVDESLRGKGYGTSLMQAAEELGRKKECISAAVNPMSWEALDFYKKLGYHVEFERHRVAGNSIFYFLRKDF